MRRTRSSAQNQLRRESLLGNPPTRKSPTVPVKNRLTNITNTLRMSTDSEEANGGKSEPPRKKKKPNITQPEMIAYEKLRVVLGRHYFDVCRRLALDYVPRCVRRVTECAQHHANKRAPRVKRVGVMRQNHTLEQIAEHRPDQFVEFLYQALMRNEFIESDLFIAAIQLILTINRPSTDLQVDYDVSGIVRGASDALEKCVERFPPCHWDLRAAYENIVLGHLDAACFNKCDGKEGLFRNVIHLLEYDIETGDPAQSGSHSERRRGKRKDGTDGTLVEEDAFFSNYNSWLTQNRQIYDFDKLPRAERFKRLFTSLRILVKVLEMDLAMWILRNPTKTRQNLCLSSRCPLVARLLWEGDYGSVNLFVKKLFQMFVNMIALKYPEDDIAIFSRLINLVAVSVNLSEFQHDDGMLQYPCLKNNSEYFAKQLWKTMECSPYYSVSVCLDTIRQTRTPYLLLFLTEELIRKLNRHDRPTNVRGFFQHVLSRSWRDCDVENLPVQGSTMQPSDPYPMLNRKKIRTKVSAINQRQYVDLLFVGFRAYCEVYQIPAYFRAIMVQSAEGDPVKTVVKNSEDHSSPPATSAASTDSGPRVPGNTRIVAEAAADARMIFQGVAVNGELLLDYREHIKYLMLIEQQLKNLAPSDEGVLFQQWMTFLADIDPSLTVNTA